MRPSKLPGSFDLLLLIGCCGFFNLSSGQAQAPMTSFPEPICDATPPGWDKAKIVKAASPWHSVKNGFIIAWRIDRREELRLEKCVVVTELGGDQDEKWAVSIVSRSLTDANWNLSILLPTPQFEPTFKTLPPIVQHKTFKKRPRNADVYAFLDAAEKYLAWDFGMMDEPELVGALICEKAWEAAIGERPTQYFVRK